jgi:1,4-dihydroxy-2-naphthoate octaprenyltransferase
MVVVSYLALVPLAIAIGPALLLPLLTAPLAVKLVRTVETHTDGPTLNGALAQTGVLEAVFCVLLSIGILLA